MKITVTGSLGNICKPLVKKLVAAGHDVKVISSTAGRVEEINHWAPRLEEFAKEFAGVYNS